MRTCLASRDPRRVSRSTTVRDLVLIILGLVAIGVILAVAPGPW